MFIFLQRRGTGGNPQNEDPVNNPAPTPENETPQSNPENETPENESDPSPTLPEDDCDCNKHEKELEDLEQKTKDLEKRQKSLELIRQLEFEKEKKDKLERQVNELKRMVQYEKAQARLRQKHEQIQQQELEQMRQEELRQQELEQIQRQEYKMERMRHDYAMKRHATTRRHAADSGMNEHATGGFKQNDDFKQMYHNAELLGLKQEDLIGQNIKKEDLDTEY